MEIFVIVYQPPGLPSAEQEGDLVKAIERHKVRVADHMPGTFLVEGQLAQLEAVLDGREDWLLAPASSVELDLPRRSFHRR
jgi:hypothetical protein